VKFFVGITDNHWFEFLSERKPDEVNFWRPRSRFEFHAIQVGEPFIFKLHSPQNFIVGGGYFVRHTILPVSLAWQAFGEKNGAQDYQTFFNRVSRLGHRTEHDPMIGCTVLAEPFFFEKQNWVSVPADWAPNIVVGKAYDSSEASGLALWSRVQAGIALSGSSITTPATIAESPGYGAEYLTRARLGQGAFRVLVTDAYGRRCAISGERTLPVLHAGHIKPFGEGGPNHVSNGLLLRSDLHILFDKGYATVTPDFHIEISPRIKDEFENGKEYYRFHGRELAVLPQNRYEIPSKEFLDWHNEHRFAG